MSDFSEKMEQSTQNIDKMEQILGKGLLQCFNNCNAGAKKIMHETHRDHVFPLMNGEKAIFETGYEIRFGDLSSSVTSTDANYTVASKISKFSFSPNHHYFLIMKDVNSKHLDVIERVSYHHITQCYGYLYNNEVVDALKVGDFIPKDTIIQKSLAFDEYNNRKDGVNFNVTYMALDKNMEDSVIFSDVAASKLVSPTIRPARIMINENDIPLNIYGTEDTYKCIPDIGEDVKDSILIALRKEKKEESVYSQSVERLKNPMMSDEKFTLVGKVIDINIYCNNPANLDGYYNEQFKRYYDELQRMSLEIVTTITPFVSAGYDLSYDLQKLYANAKRVLNHDQYVDNRLFSNIILEVTVLEEKKLEAGDKTSNRYGGKGVVSTILPQNQMPRYKNGNDLEYVDIILNSSTMYNRENPGQLFELSLTHIGNEIINYISKGNCTVQEAANMIYEYVSLISPVQAASLKDEMSRMNVDEMKFLVESIMMDKAIHLSSEPISESFDIDRLIALYDKFPWVEQVEIEVPMTDSNGSIRYVKARRKIVVGKQYTFRLKQFAEEKFSATSLSATNIRNENTKSKANRDCRELHSNTPIRFGNMEVNNKNHLGAANVVINLLIHSLSPHARRLAEQLYTCDPFHIDIKLDSDARNRSAEIVQTYLKTIGRRLVFKKIKKVKQKITVSPVTFTKAPIKSPIFFVKQKGFNFDKDFEQRQKIEDAKAKNEKLIQPIYFEGRDMKRYRADQEAYENYIKERDKNKNR